MKGKKSCQQKKLGGASGRKKTITSNNSSTNNITIIITTITITTIIIANTPKVIIHQNQGQLLRNINYAALNTNNIELMKHVRQHQDITQNDFITPTNSKNTKPSRHLKT